MAVALLSPESLEAERARRDFKLFVKLAWSVIEPGTPFVPGWHLDAIADHLQAVSAGQIKRLLVNMPPRHGKSTLISVLWPMWAWISDPSIRWLCGSYAMNLATRDNLKCRRLIKSNWFQERYSHVFTLTRDQDAKTKYETDHMGYRMSVSVGSSATGEGGDILLLDDPHNIDEKESDAKREAALDWFNNTWSTRLNDQQRGAMVVVGQRIHEKDVSGHILDTNDGEWVHLNLPAEYDPASSCKTYLPSGKAFWKDPRTEDGELLWEARFPRPVIEKAKRRHGPLAYGALYGQNPTTAGGTTFDARNERVFEQNYDTYFLHTPKGVKAVKKAGCEIILPVDPAISEAQSADYTVIGTWAKTPTRDLLLLNVRRDHWNHGDQQDEIEDEFQESGADYVVVETVAYQSALFQDLMEKGIPCKGFTPKTDKVARATGAAIWHRNGKMYFPKDAEWLETYKKELYKFPRSPKDDQVDMTSLAGIAVRSNGPLSDNFDENDIPDPIEGPADNETISFTQDWRDPGATASVILPRKEVDPFSWVEKHGGWE